METTGPDAASWRREHPENTTPFEHLLKPSDETAAFGEHSVGPLVRAGRPSLMVTAAALPWLSDF